MVRLTLLLSLVCLTGIVLGLPTNDDLEIALEHHHDHSHHDDTSDSSEEDRHHSFDSSDSSDSSEEDRHHTVDSSDSSEEDRHHSFDSSDSSDSSEEDRHHTVDSSDESHDHHDHHLNQGIDLTNGTCIEKAERLLKYLWQLYKARFQLHFSRAEEALRKAIFRKALDKIKKHNWEADLGMHPFHMGLSPLSCLSDEEMAARKGLKLDRSRNSENERTYVPVGGPLPDSVDWRTKGWVTPVKDQGQCGSCYTFSATGALEGQLFNKTHNLTSLSEQNLLDCSTAQGNMGCNGGTVNNAFNYVKVNKGIDTEISYPYEGKQGRCRYTTAGASGATVSGILNVQRGSEDSLKALVANHGPVSVAIDSSQKCFQNYKSGVYKCTQKPKIDHAVLVVGYAPGYWIVKNSWGTCWGNAGYVYISTGGEPDNCGITQQASAPVS